MAKKRMSRKRSKPKPSQKKTSKTTTTKRKAAGRKKAAVKRTASARKTSPRKKKAQGESGEVAAAFSRPARGASGRQAGDLQGISNRERADSESVDELLEEGNAFEAGAVAGVEAADDADEQEVHTHEVPEDDVPREYTDED